MSMTKDEAKEILPIIQAYAEGKIIECRTKPSTVEGTDVPNDWTEMKEIEFWKNIEYRIKPDSKAKAKYRPFANVEECWTEMKKHQPFGWVKDKKDGYYVLITAVDNGDYMSLSGNSGWSFYSLMKDYTFADGTHFGVKVEE
ncbi:hypothetical protein DW657_17100 [Prevotella sp. AM23-5]|nr:hypothetical protein DW657_17100 [Prevotella sp. AM23-5]